MFLEGQVVSVMTLTSVRPNTEAVCGVMMINESMFSTLICLFIYFLFSTLFHFCEKSFDFIT